MKVGNDQERLDWKSMPNLDRQRQNDFRVTSGNWGWLASLWPPHSPPGPRCGRGLPPLCHSGCRRTVTSVVERIYDFGFTASSLDQLIRRRTIVSRQYFADIGRMKQSCLYLTMVMRVWYGTWQQQRSRHGGWRRRTLTADVVVRWTVRLWRRQ